MKHPRARKKWGQNFLADKNIARKIVAAVNAPEPRLIIEIGPGRGVLTDLLYELADHYCGIEIDPLLAAPLQERFAGSDKSQIIQQDFMKLDLSALLGQFPGLTAAVVGNIPYNITSPILFRLFDHADQLHQAVLMMQKEVGERLTAQPGSKSYGLLAINAQLFAETELLFGVPSHLFSPRPRVDSAVLRLTFRKGVSRRFSDFDLFRKIIRHSFQNRRKMLRKSLSVLFSAELLSKLTADLTQRPEQLSIDAWIALTESISRHLKESPSP